MDEKRLLQHNPDQIKVVPDAQREMWTRTERRGWLCENEDGRGRCTSRKTIGYV